MYNIVGRIIRQISRKAHGILVKAKKQGLISELKPLILELKKKEFRFIINKKLPDCQIKS